MFNSIIWFILWYEWFRLFCHSFLFCHQIISPCAATSQYQLSSLTPVTSDGNTQKMRNNLERVENQSVNGKYNLISVYFNRIISRISAHPGASMYPCMGGIIGTHQGPHIYKPLIWTCFIFLEAEYTILLIYRLI